MLVTCRFHIVPAPEEHNTEFGFELIHRTSLSQFRIFDGTPAMLYVDVAQIRWDRSHDLF